MKERTNTLKHVIEVAEYCKSLNNFNAMMEIISGLNNSAVFRLKQTWGVSFPYDQHGYCGFHFVVWWGGFVVSVSCFVVWWKNSFLVGFYERDTPFECSTAYSSNSAQLLLTKIFRPCRASIKSPSRKWPPS